MDDFEFIQPLSTHPRFTVFEAYAKKLGFQVVLKQCAFTTLAEVEFFVRSALIKTRDRVYSQPLLSIFASGEESKQVFINFVWKRGEGLDAEVEKDQKSQFPSGKNGLETQKPALTNPHTGVSVKRVRCLTLGKEVICKVFKKGQMLDMNDAFREALAQARCSHPNICDLIDFRMYQGKKHNHCAYIVVEWLEPDLDTEMQLKVSNHQLYEEIELINILKDVIAGLLHAKSQDLAYNDIKPSNILRGHQGLKLANFGSTWLRGQYSTTSTAICTDIYISPETWETMANPENLQRPFESDVFSLGMTMLHLAAMESPERTMSHGELQRKVQALRYSEELKQLLAEMLNTAPDERPPLETVQTDAGRIYRQATLAQEALQLRLQARTIIAERINSRKTMMMVAAAHANIFRIPKDEDELRWMKMSAEALEKYAAAHTILSRLPDDKDTANNLKEWGGVLYKMGREAEAVEKYEAAHAILSQLPDDKDTANNLREWGDVLYSTGREAEAVKKYAAAHDILSRLSVDRDTANNLRDWGDALRYMKGREAEAVEKFEAAHDILSRLPVDRDSANNLRDWGNVLKFMEGREAEAVEKFEAAHDILSRLPDDKDTANSLREWGDVLYSTGREAEAAEKYAAAHAILSRLPDDEDTADDLREWGYVLYELGREAEAAEKYAAAHDILSRLSVDRDTANNLREWGDALRYLEGREAEAVEKFEAARAIFVLYQLNFDTCRAALSH